LSFPFHSTAFSFTAFDPPRPAVAFILTSSC
jgi:hypothetical protein